MRPGPNKAIVLCIFFVLLCISRFASSEDFSFHAFVSTSYSYNFNTPDSGKNQFRVFDFDDNTFKLDVAEFVLEKAVPEPGNVGFRVDLMAGASIPRVIAASGLFRDPETGEAEDFDVQQAYVSVNAGGLRIDFGKHITHAGAEVIEGYDGFNDNYTRSLLFGFAIPFTHTGIRASHTFNDHVSLTGYLVNGWDNVKDNNRGKSFGGQLTVSPSSAFTAYVNYLGGPEQNDSDNMRNLFDFVAVWKPTSRIAVTFNYDHATDENGVAEGVDSSWDGFALYAKFSFRENCSFTVRGEKFNDDDGVRTGIAQELREITLTPEFRVHTNFVIRGDLRFDHSDKLVFDEDGDLSDNQTTVAFNLLYFF